MQTANAFRSLASWMTLLVLSSSICLAEQPSAGGSIYFPSGANWETVTAQEAHVSAEKLKKALTYAGNANSGGVVILWRGKILAEQYWDGWKQETTHPLYSATKSLTSTLVGIAIEEGKIKSVNQSVSDFMTEWKGKPDHEAIQIQHLLSMTGGLQGGRRNFLMGVLAADERRFATDLPVEHKPGTQWDYHNAAYHLLCPILEQATGKTLTEYSAEKIWRPLEMEHPSWFKKRRGVNQYSHMEMTCRDAARFGLLVLAKGDWRGTRIISEQWLQQATKPWDATVNSSYGYLWWLNGGDSYYLPLRTTRTTGPIMPGCPDDAIAALGKDDQKIYVVPSRELVVVRLGAPANASAPALSEFDAEFLGLICNSFSN